MAANDNHIATDLEDLGDAAGAGGEVADAAPEGTNRAGAQVHPIISCSRRTDVPAHYIPWLVRGLQAGEVTVTVRGHVSRVSLRPEDVKAWVWWSKNYAPWLAARAAHPELFAFRAHIFHFTITGLEDLENVEPSIDERINQITQLAAVGHVVVRFDPITRYRDEAGVVRSNHPLAETLIPHFKAAGAHEVEFKFCVPYRGTLARMARGRTPFVAFMPEEKRRIVRRLMDICAAQQLRLRACCPLPEERVEGLEVGSCIDGETIEKLLGGDWVNKRKDAGQRKACRCVASRDIGDYRMHCPHACRFCYGQPGPLNPAFR